MREGRAHDAPVLAAARHRVVRESDSVDRTRRAVMPRRREVRRSSNAVTGCPRSSRRPPRAGSPPTRALVCRGLERDPARGLRSARLAARVAALPSRAPRNRTRAPPAQRSRRGTRHAVAGGGSADRAPYLAASSHRRPARHPQRRASATARAPAAKRAPAARRGPSRAPSRNAGSRPHATTSVSASASAERGADAHPRCARRAAAPRFDQRLRRRAEDGREHAVGAPAPRTTHAPSR